MSAIRAAALFCLAFAAPETSLAARSGWTQAGEAQLRLLSLPVGSGGVVTAGVEIVMTPGWHTYWRTPGEVGIPPRFDFSESDNVASVEVSFPAPERFDDGASVSVIYRDQVVFPLRVTARDPNAPVDLRLAASFGVCNTICIPAEAQAGLMATVHDSADPLSDTVLARARERLPQNPLPGRFDIHAVTLIGQDELEVQVIAPASSYSDLFVEPPADWTIGQPELVRRQDAGATYRLALAGRPAGTSASGQHFRFVAVAGSAAIEKTVTVP